MYKNQERVNHCFINRQRNQENQNQILELSVRKFIIMFNMFSNLMEKVNSRHKQIKKCIKEMKII